MSVVVLQSSVPAHVDAPATHAFVVSLHVSAPLHATPSEQLRATPAQTRALHTSPSVQNAPSSQRAPSFALQPTRDVATVHTSHAFVGFTCPTP